MKVNPIVYGLVILVVFFGLIGGAKAAGIWSVSGKLTAGGEKIAPAGVDVSEIKGWMTLGDVAAAYQVPLSEIAAAFDLPADVAPTAQLKELESDAFSVSALRAWLTARSGQ